MHSACNLISIAHTGRLILIGLFNQIILKFYVSLICKHVFLNEYKDSSLTYYVGFTVLFLDIHKLLLYPQPVVWSLHRL